MNQQLRQLYTRVAGILGIGRITGQSDSGNIQTVQYQTPLEVASARRMAEFGFSSGLPSGSDVLIGFLGGDRSNPVIIASNHQGFRHQGLSAGETAIYNQWGMYVLLTEKGIEIEANGQDVTVKNGKKVDVTATESVKLITPQLLVTGNIIDNCESNTKMLKDLRDAYNNHDHVTQNVRTGSDSVTSNKPEDQV